MSESVTEPGDQPGTVTGSTAAVIHIVCRAAGLLRCLFGVLLSYCCAPLRGVFRITAQRTQVDSDSVRESTAQVADVGSKRQVEIRQIPQGIEQDGRQFGKVPGILRGDHQPGGFGERVLAADDELDLSFKLPHGSVQMA